MNVPRAPDQPETWLGSVKGKAVSVTALLLLIPALINSAVDVVKAITNIPSNIYDKTNTELFKIHWKEPPVLSQPVPVRVSATSVDMLLEVYGNGDIFIKYGEFQQWFPFKNSSRLALFKLIADASAQETQPAATDVGDGRNRLIQQQVIDIDSILREQKAQQASEATTTPPTIERAYVLAQSKDDHASISPLTSTYVDSFKSEPGYSIVKYDLRVSSAGSFRLDKVALNQDRSELQITYSLSSGPFFDRWHGWVKATVQTTQLRTK